MKSCHNFRKGSVFNLAQATSAEDALFYPPFDRTDLAPEAYCTPQADGIIRLRAIRPELDRLRLTVKHQRYHQVKHRLEEHFGHFEPIHTKRNDREIKRFRYGETNIDLVRPWDEHNNCPKPYRRFEIQVSGGPTEEVQKILIDVVLRDLVLMGKNIGGHPIVAVSEIEFALDLIPENPEDIPRLWGIISSGAFLINTFGRGSQIVEDGTDTLYLASFGNKRLASKGITIYQYPAKERKKKAVRVELQVKRCFIKSHLSNYADFLQIIPIDLLNPFDFIEYRSYDEAKFNVFFNKEGKRPVPSDPRFATVRARLYESVHSAFCDIDKSKSRIEKDDNDHMKRTKHPRSKFDSARPAIPAIYAGLKSFIKNHDRRVDEFFPLSPKDAAIRRDMAAKFIRCDYAALPSSPMASPIAGKKAQSLAALKTNATQTMITREAIIAAMVKLIAEGQKPTQGAVAKLAGRCRRTVNTHWQNPEVQAILPDKT